MTYLNHLLVNFKIIIKWFQILKWVLQFAGHLKKSEVSEAHKLRSEGSPCWPGTAEALSGKG